MLRVSYAFRGRIDRRWKRELAQWKVRIGLLPSASENDQCSGCDSGRYSVQIPTAGTENAR